MFQACRLMQRAALLTESGVRKIPYDLKEAIAKLRKHGIELAPPYDDPLLMAYLLFPNRGKYELPTWYSTRLEDAGGRCARHGFRRCTNTCDPVDEQVREVYQQIELPLIPVLANMERTGIGIDPGVLRKMSAEMGVQIRDLTRRIYEEANCEFNLNSPRQLGEVLFEKMNLPHKQKLKKSGQYSTAVEVLEELAESYALPRMILEYRQLAKFKSTYVDVIPKLIDPTDIPTAHVIQPDGRRDRPAVEQQSEPAEHSGADGTRDGRFAERLCRSRDGGLSRRTIRRWSCGSSRISRAMRDWLTRSRQVKTSIVGPQPKFWGFPSRSHARPARPRQGRQLRHCLRSDAVRTGAATGHQH